MTRFNSFGTGNGSAGTAKDGGGHPTEKNTPETHETRELRRNRPNRLGKQPGPVPPVPPVPKWFCYVLLVVATTLAVPIVAWLMDRTAADVANVLLTFFLAFATVLAVLIGGSGMFLGIWHVVSAGLRRDDNE